MDSVMRLAVVIGVCLAWVLTIHAAEAETTLVKDGVSDWYIVISKYSILSERHAASELQSFLQQISGAELPILEYEEPGAIRPMHTHEIILGINDRVRKLCEEYKVAVDFGKLGEEGFVIRTIGPHLIIAGGRPRGTLYGVYTFLEDYLGCRWYDSTVSVIPKRPTITLGEINDTQVPAVRLRQIDWGNFRYDANLAARNKVNGPDCPLSETHGGKFILASRRCHTFNYLLDPNKYFKDHPEYYALVDGKRQATQPCLTNPEAQAIMIENVKRWMREEPNARVFHVSQNDNDGYCRCPDCQALDEQQGSPQGSLLTFINRLADEVKEEFPDRYIMTFAYAYSEKAPKDLRPRPNVIIELCTFACCSIFSYEQEGFCYADYLAWRNDQPYEQQSFAKNMQRWAALTDNLFVWDYPGSLNHGLMPHPSLLRYQENLRFLVKNHMIGYYAQPGYPGPPAELNGLRGYLLAKLAWNPDWDVEKGLTEYLEAMYGPAAGHIRRYINLIHERAPVHDTEKPPWDPPFSASWTHCSPTRWWLKPEYVEEYQTLFDEAEKLVQNDERLLRRVRVVRLGPDYVQIRTLKPGDPVRDRVIERFFQTLEAAGIEDIGYAIIPREYTAAVRHCSPAMFKAYLEAGGQ